MVKKRLTAGILLMFFVILNAASVTVNALDLNMTSKLTVVMAYNNKALGSFNLTVVRVADAKLENDGSISYELTENFESSKADLTNISLAAENKSIAALLNQYALSNSIVREKRIADANGKAVFSDLDAGLYLVTQQGEYKGYVEITPFLVPMPAPVLNAAGEISGWSYVVTTYPKTEPKMPEPTTTEPTTPEPTTPEPTTPEPTTPEPTTPEPTTTQPTTTQPTTPEPTTPQPTTMEPTTREPTEETTESSTEPTLEYPTEEESTTPSPTEPMTERQTLPSPRENPFPEMEIPDEIIPLGAVLVDPDRNIFVVTDEDGNSKHLQILYDEEEDEWIIEEVDIPLSDFSVVKTDIVSQDILPQTGVLRWPVPIMAVSGALIFTIGLILTWKAKKNYEN